VPGDQGAGNQPTADKRLELAYDAGVKALAMQDATLGSVRTRASNLLSAAALFTSVSTAIGLINTNPDHGAVLAPWKAIVLIAVVAALGVCVVYVLWTTDWSFGPDPQQILDKVGEDESAIREFVTKAMIAAIATNLSNLKRKQKALRWAASLLIAEVVLLILFVAF
jgi:hypothetical protein